tara:strand:+ start:582 stop:1484 length:903 start_codon:yes stop_codon:yes gene_type:complete
MFKFISFFLILIICFNVKSNESSLTIQQQLERLQREVSDLSQTIYSNNNDTKKNDNNDLVTNLSAIDMRIYDIEKDIKNLTSSLEDIFFQIDDLLSKISNFEEVIYSIENNPSKLKINEEITDDDINNEITQLQDDNTLGSLKINTEDQETENNNIDDSDVKKEIDKKQELLPEDQFQLAFDNIRAKNWEEAKNSFSQFIKNYPDNQLSGSAHYWLGELHILEKNYREAALVFAEGYQKFPESIKAPDMLFKLSQSLYKVNKLNETCKTLELLITGYPNSKFIKNSNKQIRDYGCLDNNE